MPKKTVFIISVISLLIGFLILGLSLLMASPAYRVGEGGKVTRTFYVGETILPDHILYPVLNIQDKMAVSLAREQDKDLVEISIAQKRLQEAKALQARNPEAEALIVGTLQKSNNYFQKGMGGLQAKEWEIPEKIIYLSEVMNRRRQTLNEIKMKLSDSWRSRIDEIITNEDLVKQQLWAKYGEVFRSQVNEERSETSQEIEKGGVDL